MKVKIGKKNIDVDVADNSIKHFFGLSFTEKKNMLFLMNYEKRWRLWMFGVRYPIKMVFMDKNKKIVDVKKGIPITEDPKTWKVYQPKKPAKFILETPYKINVKIGQTLSW